MGCCSSSDANASQPSASAPPPSSSGTSPPPPAAASNNAQASSPAAAPASSPAPAPAQEAPATDPDKYEDPHSRNPRAHPDQQDQPTSEDKAPRAGAAPTGGAYRGWAPPTKEQFSETASKGQKTRITVEDQWDEDGNLTRITTTKTFAPDWKTTTKKEIIPAAKAAEMGIARKNK